MSNAALMFIEPNHLPPKGLTGCLSIDGSSRFQTMPTVDVRNATVTVYTHKPPMMLFALCKAIDLQCSVIS